MIAYSVDAGSKRVFGLAQASNEFAETDGLPSTQCPNGNDESDALSLTVVFTSPGATICALRYASLLADRLGAGLRVLAPQVVPYPLPIHCPDVEPVDRLEQFRREVSEEQMELTIDVSLCRDINDALREGLKPGSLVVIGGPDHWWPTFEKRLVNQLRRAGHHSIFVPQGKYLGEPTRFPAYPQTTRPSRA